MPDYSAGRDSTIECPDLVIGVDTRIGSDVTIDVRERLVIGRHSFIGDGTVIRGRDIEIKREFHAVGQVTIGGGSCFEKRSRLQIGFWGHLGLRSFVNTAESVEIGNEVGIGGESKLYTHGAYLDVLQGFPIQWGPIRIGSHVWMPLATVHPGVTIGDNVVVGSHSLVTHDIPSGCLATGIPCRVIKENIYPCRVADWKRVIEDILRYYQYNLKEFQFDDTSFRFDSTRYDIESRSASGTASPRTEQLRDRLRRRGIRFKTEVIRGKYVDWESDF